MEIVRSGCTDEKVEGSELTVRTEDRAVERLELLSLVDRSVIVRLGEVEMVLGVAEAVW